MNRWLSWFSTTAVLYSISVPSAATALESNQSYLIQSSRGSALQLAQANSPEFELENFDFWAEQCRSFTELKDYENAVKACERAIVLKPRQDNADLWMARSDALFQLQRFPEALTSYSYLLTLTPSNSLALTQQCIILYHMGNNERAIDACENALRINGDWGTATPAIAWYNRGLALQRAGKAAEALDSFDRAQQITPDDRLIQAERCRLLPALGQDATVEQNCNATQTVVAYENALAEHPDDAIAWTHQGLVLEQTSQTARALTAYENAIRINPKSSVALARQCALLNQMKQYDAALAACDAALQGDRQWQGTAVDEVWNQKSQALLGLERYEDAVGAADRAITLNAENASAWNAKAVALWKLGRYAEAQAAIGMATATNPRFAEAWFNQGRILSSQSNPNYKEVIFAYCQALGTSQYNCPIYTNEEVSKIAVPSDPVILADILTNLTAALCQMLDYDAAAAAGKDATDRNPTSFAAWYNRGLALIHLGDRWQTPDIYQEAEAVYRRADQLNSNNIYVLTGIGRALAGQGQTQAAIAAFETALNLSPNFAPAQDGLNQLLRSKKLLNGQ